MHQLQPVAANAKNGASITSCICHGCPFWTDAVLSFQGGPDPVHAYARWMAGADSGPAAIHIDPRRPNGDGGIADPSCSPFPRAKDTDGTLLDF